MFVLPLKKMQYLDCRCTNFTRPKGPGKLLPPFGVRQFFIHHKDFQLATQI